MPAGEAWRGVQWLHLLCVAAAVMSVAGAVKKVVATAHALSVPHLFPNSFASLLFLFLVLFFPFCSAPSETSSVDSNESPTHNGESNRWANMPVRYFRFVDDDGRVSPIPERGDGWSWRTFLSYAGPGFLVAISYLDPGNLEADLQAGSYTKYQLTWVLVVTSGIGLALQAMSVKIGIVTGKHLAQLCRQEYSTSKWVSMWIMAEISIIASDVQAVVTSAIALKILFKLPLWIGCILTACDALTFLSLHLLGIRSLEGFFVAIVCVMSVCFFWTFSLRPPDPFEVVTGLLPTIPSYGLSTAVGVVGSLILPQNYFVHSAVVLSRRVDRSSGREVREATKYMVADAAVALFVALCLNFAVISNFAELFFHIDCATASTTSACIADSENFHHHHYGECMTKDNGPGYCQHIGLSDADAALEFALGPTAGLIWACGLLASGQSSTMTITYAGQFVNEGFGEFHIPLYQRISICRLVALIPAVIAATIEATHPSSMDDATQIGNIIGSICVPFTIVPMIKFCNSTRLMGEHTIDWLTSTVISILAILLILLNCGLFYEYFLKIPHLPVLVSTLLGLLTAIGYIYLNYLMINEEVDMLLFSLFKKFELFCGCPWSILVGHGDHHHDNWSDLSSSRSSINRSSHNLLSSKSPDLEDSERSLEISSQYHH